MPLLIAHDERCLAEDIRLGERDFYRLKQRADGREFAYTGA
jgi:hypothetical protein